MMILSKMVAMTAIVIVTTGRPKKCKMLAQDKLEGQKEFKNPPNIAFKILLTTFLGTLVDLLTTVKIKMIADC